MVRLTDRPAMTIAVYLGRKATKQTKQNYKGTALYLFNPWVNIQTFQNPELLKFKF